jgi:hypothetical protein
MFGRRRCMHMHKKRAVARAGIRRRGFEPESGHVRFMVDKVALGQVSSQYFRFPCQFSLHELFHTGRALLPRNIFLFLVLISVRR